MQKIYMHSLLYYGIAYFLSLEPVSGLFTEKLRTESELVARIETTDYMILTESSNSYNITSKMPKFQYNTN